MEISGLKRDKNIKDFLSLALEINSDFYNFK